MAVVFNAGSNQYLSRPVALLTAFPISMTCWWKPTSFTTTQVIMGIGTSSGGSGGANTLTIYSDTTAHVFAQQILAGASAKAQAVATLVAGAWHHLVAVFASTTSRTIYLNNVPVTNTTSQNLGSMTITSIGCYFGGGTATYPSNGTIAYPAMWDVALSAADVAALYNGGAGADPRIATSQNSALQSFTELSEPSSPWLDQMTGVAWTTNGVPVTSTDPFPIIDQRIVHVIT